MAKDERIDVRLDADVQGWLSALARKEGNSVGSIVRRILYEAWSRETERQEGTTIGKRDGTTRSNRG